MTNFDSIVSKHGLENDFLPLWKIIVKMTPEDINELITHIRTEICYGRNVMTYSREVCLMYAYWWQKNFQGGKGGRNYEDALNDFKLTKYDETIFRKAVLDELKDQRRLGIKVYRKETNRWLDSVFAQGGIPINWLANSSNNSQLRRFLRALLNHYENVATPDWYDLTLAQEIASNLSMPLLVQSEAFCSYCLSVVQSIICNVEIVSGYETLRKIIQELKDVHKKQPSKFFGINWSLKMGLNNDLSLCYTLRVPKTIASEEDSRVTSRRYFLNGKFVAEYLRQGNKFFLQLGHNIPINQELEDGVETMFLERMDDNKDLESEILSNSTIPIFEEPMMMDCSTNFWKIDAGYNEEVASIIYPKRWTPKTDIHAEKIRLGDVELLYATIDWNDYEDGKIIFYAEDSECTIRRDNVDYQVYLNFPQYEWIESSNKLIVESGCDLKRSIYVRDASGNIISERNWELQTKSKDRYVAYHNTGSLNYGINNLRICMPNGRNRYIQFFLIDKIEYSCLPNNRMIFKSAAITNERIVCKLLEGQNVSLNDGEYVCDESISSVKFVLMSSGTEVKVAVAAPKPKSSFWDMQTNKKLTVSKRISVSQLYKYKVYLDESSKLNLLMKDDRNNIQLMNIWVQWTKSQFHTLSFASGIIDRMLMLFPLTRNRTLEMSVGNQRLIISGNHYWVDKTKSGDLYRLFVIGNNEPICNLSLSAIPLSTVLTETRVIDLVEDSESGYYIVPTDIANEPFIVYSKNASMGFQPQKIDWNEDEMEEQDQIDKRNNDKNISLEKITLLLSDYDDKSWSHVWKQFELIVKNHLPFITFNSMVALSNNPSHLAYFITHLRTKYSEAPDDVVMELERMEKELGFAFHAIPVECWKTAVDSVRESYEKLKDIFSSCGISEETYINQCYNLYEELLNRQFGESIHYSGLNIRQIFNPQRPLSQDVRVQMESYYAAKLAGTYLTTHSRMRLPQIVGLGNIDNPRPFCGLKFCETIENYMRYFAVACPQISARNAQNLDDNYWKYSESSDCIKRITNYIRQYAKEAYNELFLAQIK